MSHAQAGLSEREAWQGTAPAGAVLSYTVRGGGVGEAWGMRQEAASSRVVGSWHRTSGYACMWALSPSWSRLHNQRDRVRRAHDVDQTKSP